MLFNSGNPSLISFTRDLINDPTTAASQMWAAQVVKDAINVSYLRARRKMGRQDQGWQEKRTYATSVADQIYYALPDDFQGMISVEVETTGKDLSSDSTASETYLEPEDVYVALEAYNRGVETTVRYYFMHDQHFGIVAPPGTGGSNSLRLVYKASSTLLSGDTDEPSVPRDHHDLICYWAAMILLTQKKMDMTGVAALAVDAERDFLRSVGDPMADYEGKIPIAGLSVRTDYEHVSGRIKRTT